MKVAGRSSAALRDIEMLFEMGTAVGLSDRELLERFARRGRFGGSGIRAVVTSPWSDGAARVQELVAKLE